MISNPSFHASARAAVLHATDHLGIGAGPPPRLLDAAGRRPESDEGPGARRIVLVDPGDGSLRWREPEPPACEGFPGGIIPELDAPRGGAVLVDIPVEPLGPNQVVARLAEWDGRLTPRQGLNRWTPGGGFAPIGSVPAVGTAPAGTPGRILLLVHGTFSQNDTIVGQLESIEAEAKFLEWASARYEHVLGFDHPTLSVGPVLNGLDLARLFADVAAPVDVICHSRGGLVVRWWLEAFGGARAGPRRAVFVASPLGGTSLASPAKLREAFDLFTTVGSHLRDSGAAASVFLPFLTSAVALMQVFVAITGAVAHSPMADLFFAAIPGLGGMSRVGNAAELDRLQRGPLSATDYFAVRSDFRMEHAGWAFWEAFQHPRLSAAEWGASQVFDGVNDLVVDGCATSELFTGKGLSPDRICNFPPNGAIYHTNYFLRPEVAAAIRGFLS